MYASTATEPAALNPGFAPKNRNATEHALPWWAGRDDRGWDIVVVPAGMQGAVYECKVRNKIQVLVGQGHEMKVFVNPNVADLDEWEMADGQRMFVGSPEDVDVDEEMLELVPTT